MTDEQLQKLAGKTVYSFEDLKLIHDDLPSERRNETGVLDWAKGATAHIKKLRRKKITNIAQYLIMINELPAEQAKLLEKIKQLMKK